MTARFVHSLIHWLAVSGVGLVILEQINAITEAYEHGDPIHWLTVGAAIVFAVTKAIRENLPAS